MSVQTKIVLFTPHFDQGDILEDFLDWHLDLGVDLILVMDYGSTDGSRELLERYSKTHPVECLTLPERDLRKYSPNDELAALARDRYGADWIIHLDADEFLCPLAGDLRAVLAQAEADGVTLLNLPRLTMTGPPVQSGQRATQTLTLRIERTLEPTPEQQLNWDLPVPFVFLDVGGHLAIRASALGRYGPGGHAATTTWGKSATSDTLNILHYAVRSFDTLLVKVRNIEVWLNDNSYLEPPLCWHWRRWIALKDQGLLAEDWDKQFLSAERAQELLDDGTCVVDRRVAEWAARKSETAAVR